MSPSGSRMQIGGTSTTGRPFCRRASRNSAEGANTEGDDGFLLSSSGGISGRSLEYNAIVIGRDFDLIAKLKPGRLDAGDGLFGRHAQFGCRATRLSEDGGFLAPPRVPT